MGNPYFIDEPAAISFSGGRTSAFMLYKILEAHDGKLPDDVKVTFANTGKEMPETLDFVRDCGENWGVDIVWLEYNGRTKREESKNYDYQYKIVNHTNASRKGEPFEKVIADVGVLPNPMSRWCSGQLKVRTMVRYFKDLGADLPHPVYVGLRADEPRRAAKLHGKISDGQELYCPMYLDGKTKNDVFNFWESQEFDLNLQNNNGTTDWGNCDMCFLKGRGKRISIARERPDLTNWWIEQERQYDDSFLRNEPNYEEVKRIALDQQDMFADAIDESIPCFCGD